MLGYFVRDVGSKDSTPQSSQPQPYERLYEESTRNLETVLQLAVSTMAEMKLKEIENSKLRQQLKDLKENAGFCVCGS